MLPCLDRITDEQWRVVRYLCVGGWNTVFGMGVYALLHTAFGEKTHYLLLAIPANILAITNAFICYKLFVFKTSGTNLLLEYLRCYLVYGGGALVNMGILWLAVSYWGWHPSLANILATTIITIISYFGHKLFTFRMSNRHSQDE